MPPSTPKIEPISDETRWFAEQVQPHEPALRAYIQGHFPTLVEVNDLFQDTYARLFRARRTGKVELVRRYLFATARNAALDLWRRRKVVAIDHIGEIAYLNVVEDRPTAADIVSYEQEFELLHEAIATLPERCRQVLLLRRFQGLSHREIGQKLGIAEKTVDAQLCIAMHRCRMHLLVHGVSRDRLEQVKSDKAAKKF